MTKVSDVEDKVARAIYASQGWTLWPLDRTDPDRDAEVICQEYWRMAKASIKEYKKFLK